MGKEVILESWSPDTWDRDVLPRFSGGRVLEIKGGKLRAGADSLGRFTAPRYTLLCFGIWFVEETLKDDLGNPERGMTGIKGAQSLHMDLGPETC